MSEHFAFLDMNFFTRASVFPGSIGTFRYRFQRTDWIGDGSIQAWVYENTSFELAKDVETETFSWTPEGVEKIKNYLRTFPGVQKYMEDIVNYGKEKGYVQTLYGRRRYLPELSASNKNIQNFGKRVAMNTPIQGTAADIIKIAMIRVYDRLAKEERKSRLILQIHDELIVETAPDEVEIVQRIVQEEMEAAASMKVKLSVEAHSGKTWFDAK